VPDAHAVVQTVKARTHPKPLADAAEPDLQVGVLEVLAELADGHQRHELARRDTDEDRQQHEHRSRSTSSSKWLRLSLHIVI
jgi:hypothetical protein